MLYELTLVLLELATSAPNVTSFGVPYAPQVSGNRVLLGSTSFRSTSGAEMFFGMNALHHLIFKIHT
jgi:hypothetical protein